MEKRPPVIRQAFQPSRSRLLQPSELFKSARQTAPSNPTKTPQTTQQKTQPAPSSSTKPQTQDACPSKPSPSQPKGPPPEEKQPDSIPRVPRLPSQSPTPPKPAPKLIKPATPFMPIKSVNSPCFAPFISKSQAIQASRPFRSANQPVAQSLRLKSSSSSPIQQLTKPAPQSIPAPRASPVSIPTPAAQATTNSQQKLPSQPPTVSQLNPVAQSRPLSEAKPVILPKPQPFAQYPRKASGRAAPKTKLNTTKTTPLPSASTQPRSTESSKSEQSQIDPQHQHAPNSRIPAEVSVQQPPVPFPLCTVPPHILQTMSKDKREGFIAGWTAGWDAHAQCMRSSQSNASNLARVSMPSEIVSPRRQIPSPKQNQHSNSSGSPPVRLTPPAVSAQASLSGVGGSSTRRVYPDPYATEETRKHGVTVGANKRPRTSSPTNTIPRPRASSPKLPASHPSTSSSSILRPQSVATAAQHSTSKPLQNGNSEARKRMSGTDAYLARSRLGPMPSVNAAFSSATTNDTVEISGKKRKRNAMNKPVEHQRQSEIRTRSEPRTSEISPRPEPRRPANVRPRLESRRPVEARPRPEPRRPVDARPRPESRRPIETRPRPELRRQIEARPRTETRRPSEIGPRPEPSRPIEKRPRLESRRPAEAGLRPNRSRPGLRREVEIRPRPEPGPTASMNVPISNGKPPAWLKGATGSSDKRIEGPVAPASMAQGQMPGTSVLKTPAAISAKTAHPNPENRSILARKNSLEMREQAFPAAKAGSDGPCDWNMVRTSQGSQEESGWGSALNKATTRERRAAHQSSAAVVAEKTVARGKVSEKLHESATGAERDPRQGPSREPSVETETSKLAKRKAEKELDDITVQAYAERFGLVIVNRDQESEKVEWVACKFCPVFGCRTRDPDYIMAHRAPFSSKKFVTHLEKDHCVKWTEYKQATAEEKGKFFSGKPLPAKAFLDRVAELKRCQDGMARRRVSPGVTEEEENAEIDNAIENLAKRQGIQRTIIDTTDDCWIGRDRFRDRGVDKHMSICVHRQNENEKTDKMPPLDRICKSIKELEINGDIAGLVLHGVLKDGLEEECADHNRGFTDTIILDGDEMRPTTLIFSGVNEKTASQAALTLRYLNDGLAGSICMALWRETLEIKAGVRMSEEEAREVLGHGNAWMALGMHIMARALESKWHNWAIGLTTRACGFMRGGAVEVLISLYDDDGEMRKAHLVTVANKIGAGAAVVEVLKALFPSWKNRLLGLHSGLCKKSQTDEKRVEASILVDLRRVTGRELMLVEHGTSREDKPIFPWALSKMCESKFDELMSSMEGPLGIALGKARVQAAKAQRANLFRRVMKGADEREVFREAWRIAGERATEISVVAEGLRTVWLCDCEEDVAVLTGNHRPGKGVVVDCDAERVLWARGLNGLWRWCGKVVEDLGTEKP